MRIGPHNTDEKCVIVAEAGNNHNGDFDTAIGMISAAKQAGADAVKFQRFVPELYDSRPERLEKLRKWVFTDRQWERLSAFTHRAGLAFICTPFDLESAEKLVPLVDAFKISSGDNLYTQLIDKILSYDRPIIVSTGGVDHNGGFDIDAQFPWGRDTAFLHCVSGYPVPDEQAQLGEEVFYGLDGYSDHTIGITAPIAAVALGARIIEKHFKLNDDCVDAAVSITPEEFAEMVMHIRRVEKMLGDGEKRIMPCEEPVLYHMHRSIRAKHGLDAGHVVTMDDLAWTRPADGLPPGEEHKIVGKRVKWEIQKNAAILEKDVE